MKAFHVDEAATKLKALIDAALKGEDIYLYSDDPKRVVRFVPGNAGSLFWTADDFEAPLSVFKEYMYPDPIIRPYQANDKSSVIKLLKELQGYERLLDDHLKLAEDSIIVPYFTQLLERCKSNNGAIYVAECDQQVVGMISLYHNNSDDLLTEVDDYLYVSDLIVTEAYRKQNIATCLLRQAEDHARKIGTRFMKLYVLAQNEAALGAYRKVGFQIDDVVMMKTLDQSV